MIVRNRRLYLQQTNSFTSEEEEIMKKEREIIEMVEKEEKSRDGDFLNQNTNIYQNNRYEKFNGPPYVMQQTDYVNNLEEQDSEVNYSKFLCFYVINIYRVCRNCSALF